MSDINNLRRNPFTSAYSWRVMDTEVKTVAEFTELPGIYGFQLQDKPQNGTVVIVENITGGATWDEVTNTPLAGQYQVDYIAGLIQFNVADDTKDFAVDYSGGGSNLSTENLIALIAQIIAN